MRLLLLLIAVTHGMAVASEISLSASERDSIGLVTVAPVPSQTARVLEATARVALPPNAEAQVTAPLAGLVTRIHVVTGNHVEQGDVLAELSSESFISLQREFLEARMAHRLESAQYERDRQLHDEGIIARRRLLESEVRAEVAAASLEEHRQLLRISGLPDDEIERLAEKRQIAQAMKLRSPLKGTVLMSNAALGQRVMAHDALFRVAGLDQLVLELQLPSRLSTRVRVGMAVSRLGESTAPLGAITSIARAVDAVSQTVLARAEMGDSKSDLQPGQILAVEILQECSSVQQCPYWRVPVSALVRVDGQDGVFVETPAGFTLVLVAVIGQDGNDGWLSGDLSDQSAVVIRGLANLKAIWNSRGQ